MAGYDARSGDLPSEMIGTTISHYRITSKLGEGGMGVVYRAEDTRLERTVALKFLAAHAVADEEWKERFAREAKASAALDHPNICTIFEIDEVDGHTLLAMALIEGSTVGQRIRERPLPLEEALEIAIQAARGLQAAHEKGIIHRDIKSANLMVTPQGQVKVMDFGLARLTDRSRITQTSTVMGTPAYMSPEQAQGGTADRRSDIWSLAVVLYEMLAGKLPFSGESEHAVLLSILEEQPEPITALRTGVPIELDRVIGKALAKKPEERYQHVEELIVDLQSVRKAAAEAKERRRSSSPSGDMAVARPGRSRFVSGWLPWCVAAAALVLAIAATMRRPTERLATLPVIRFRFGEPEGTWLQRFVTRRGIAISPHGGKVAMIAHDAQGSRIWLRRLDSASATHLAGTEGAKFLFWSPDGREVGFHADGKLKRVRIEGGSAVTICELADASGASWGEGGRIAVAVNPRRGQHYRVNVETGAVTQMEGAIRSPQFLPGGNAYLHIAPDPASGFRAHMVDWASGRSTSLLSASSQVLYAAGSSGGGYLVFVKDAALLAQRFDPGNPAVTSEPVALASNVPFFTPTGWAEFDVSADGHLIFGTGIGLAALSWMDRAGQEVTTIGDLRTYWAFARRHAPSSRIVFDVFDPPKGSTDIWTVDERSGLAHRLTFDSGAEASGVWSPDGRQIVFARSPLHLSVFSLADRKTIDYPPAPTPQFAMDWSPDGKWICYQTNGGETPGEIWFASAGEDRKVYPILKEASYGALWPVFSPDGKYLAYTANQTGRLEVYVQELSVTAPPKLTGEARRVSANGGTSPGWRRDGREFYFLSLQGELMAATATAGLVFGVPRKLFTIPLSAHAMNPGGAMFQPNDDGSRFLIIHRRPSRDPLLEAVINWQAGQK